MHFVCPFACAFVGALVKSGTADVRICGCCTRIRARVTVRVRITVRDGMGLGLVIGFGEG